VFASLEIRISIVTSSCGHILVIGLIIVTALICPNELNETKKEKMIKIKVKKFSLFSLSKNLIMV
jgi:hypothetical protein